MPALLIPPRACQLVSRNVSRISLKKSALYERFVGVQTLRSSGDRWKYRCLADRMRPYDVTVSTIALGDTPTERFVATRAVDPARMAEGGTLDRIATVDQVSRIIEFFVGPMGAFVSGQVVRVDGGSQTWAA